MRTSHKLRGYDLVGIRVSDVVRGRQVRLRAMVAHRALDAAIEQGRLFCNMLKASCAVA